MSNNTVNILKGISIPLILLLGLLPGIFPIYCKRCQQNPKCLSVINAFSGGIFLAVGLLHIYPETIIEFQNDHAHTAEKFPLPALCYILGFLAIFGFEKICCRHSHKHVHGDAPKPKSKYPNLERSNKSIDNVLSASPQPSETNRDLTHINVDLKEYEDKSQTQALPFWRALIIVIAFSLHSIFEGFALGLEEVEDDLIGLFLAIVLHKWAMSLSLKQIKALILVIIFAVVTPLGIGIGWAVLHLSTGLTAIILSAFSAGTFLYIGAFEIPDRQFSEEKDPQRVFKFVMYCVGFCTMMVVDVIMKNTYGHGGHDH